MRLSVAANWPAGDVRKRVASADQQHSWPNFTLGHFSLGNIALFGVVWFLSAIWLFGCFKHIGCLPATMVWWNPFRKDKVSTEVLPSDWVVVQNTQKCDTDTTLLTETKFPCQKCPDDESICHHRSKYYDKVVITDDDNKYKTASQKCYTFWFWKLFYTYFRFLIDGLGIFCPTWDSVLRLDEVTSQNKAIYVRDSLFLCFESPESLDKIIPYISGPYTRLTLRGKITFNQVKQLIHDDVEKVYLTNEMELQPDENDDFVALLVKHNNTFDSLFAMWSHMSGELKEKIIEAFEEHPTHRFDDRFWNIYHKDYAKVYYKAFTKQLVLYIILHVMLMVVCSDKPSDVKWACLYTLPIVVLDPFIFIFFRGVSYLG